MRSSPAMQRVPHAVAVTVATIGAGAVPYLFAVIAWPEVVVPAYFIGRGGVLYDTIFFPHTPLLISITAALGRIFGYSEMLFRSIVAVTTALGAAAIVLSMPRRTGAVAAGVLIGVPFYVSWLAATDSLALWPDPMMAPIVLAAGLALEQFERRVQLRPLGAGALLLGVCILIKQTSAWIALASGAWLLIVSRRRSLRAVLTFSLAVALPYALFVIGWAAMYRTWSHVRWTLIIPLLSGHASEIARFVSEDFVQRLPVYLGSVAACAGAVLLIPAAARLRSPLPWLLAGSAAMAWPRGDLGHMAAGFAVAAVLISRGAAAALLASHRVRRGAVSIRAIACVLVVLTVVVSLAIFALPRVSWKRDGPVFFWTDRASRFFAAEVQRQVAPGGAFLNYNTPWETLYAITGTTTPNDIYVNPKFWYYLNKEGLGQALCADLQARAGTLVLFSYLDPRVEDAESAETCLYRMLVRAPVVRQVTPVTSWRMIPAHGERRR